MSKIMKMTNPKSRFIFLCAMALIVGAMGCMIVFSQGHLHFDPLVIASFCINIVLFFVKYLQSINDYAFSLDQMFWLFSLFFFGFAPLLQFLTGTYSWNLDPTNQEVLGTNLLILLWSVCYIVGQKVKIGKYFRRKLPDCLPKKAIKGIRLSSEDDGLNPHTKPILLGAAVLVAIYFMVAVGFSNMFSRSTASVQGLSTAMSLLVTHVFKNTVVFVVAFFVIDAKRKKKITWELAIALLCLVLVCFPLSLARNMMASFYAGLLIIMFDQTRKGRWFSLVILCGLVLVYPAVEIFRRAGTVTSLSDIGPMMLQSIRETYLQGHYDAHQMFISIRRYVDVEGFSWGYQLLGALLFFVPRSIWPSKPYGSGQTAFEVLQQHSFTNVSAPLVSEAYVNFGLIGIIVIGFLLGKCVRKLDRVYWSNNNPYALIRVIYPFSIFMFFFMLRGDLMSSWAYTFAQIVVGVIWWCIAIRKLQINREYTGGNAWR